MTATEQRVALAEWMGLAPETKHTAPSGSWDFILNPVPDFLNDLNAVHAVEKVLQDKCKYWPDYIDELSKLFRFEFPRQSETNWSQMVHATAAQRCEALLKTVGLWKYETPPQPAP